MQIKVNVPTALLVVHIVGLVFTALWVWLYGFHLLLWVSVLGSFSLCVPIYVIYFSGEVQTRLAWTLIFSNLAVSLLILSQVHVSTGIAFSGLGCVHESAPCVSRNWADGIYFSIVTFTTLGYGDYQPVGYGRYFAATQALAGYIVLGLTVGAVLHWAQERSRP